ncbi:MAG TPA: hypothetical protein VGH33_15830, partial [Isosphaeraceae bacterium]
RRPGRGAAKGGAMIPFVTFAAAVAAGLGAVPLRGTVVSDGGGPVAGATVILTSAMGAAAEAGMPRPRQVSYRGKIGPLALLDAAEVVHVGA